ncbi:class III lanthionine synthetase LanKC [Pendulispora albinea]|uniref:Class III lanthionine synthetase LanKC n=1 Tax=Pendulispora albinea TaxID=2741071 RepID=A0ABZ2M6G9_9BACT
MDASYEAYCLADPFFYESPARMDREGCDDFALANRALPAGWQRHVDDTWVRFRPDDISLPQQGWKVHVSGCMGNANRILEAVWEYCVPARIAFKFLRGPAIHFVRNTKYAQRNGSGKLVTIYPADEAALAIVLHELNERIGGEPGPYILSDLRYARGPLYVRYGNFAQRTCRDARGVQVSAIADPDGKLVPDVRGPVFAPPVWVRLPEFLRPHVEARNAIKADGLPYQVESALHFSNGGGVYLGRHRDTGERVVIKEARPYAGLSLGGLDAVARLERERDTLQRLAGIEAVPRVLGYHVVGEHHFLIEELIDGVALNRAQVQRYPLLTATPDPAAIAEYTEWALRIHAQAARALEEIHARDIVFGDLHPRNIMIGPDGRLTLVDFEVAFDVSRDPGPMLGAPGFTAPSERTGFERDAYSLACLRLALFLPITTLLRADPSKVFELVDTIVEHFPVERSMLLEDAAIVLGRAYGDAPRRRETRELPDAFDWPLMRRSLAAAIVASATPERDDRLFPGDPAQFRVGGCGLAHGAAGVLYALAMTGAGTFPPFEEWLVRQVKRGPHKGSGWGFYHGLHGVAHVLDRLGHRAEALAIVERGLRELPGELGLDLAEGLSGIALNLDHLGEAAGDSTLRGEALRLAQNIADRLGGVEQVGPISGGKFPYAGLMLGASGPALLFVHLYEQTRDSVFLDHAAVALRQDLRRCIARPDGCLQVNEGWRRLPYLDGGSTGIGLVLDRYLAHRHDEAFAEASAGIRIAARSRFYVQPGLLRGRAGMVLYSSQLHGAGAAIADPEVREQVRRLNWHALSYRGHLAFPGDQLLRLSMDLATGNAGVLLALGAACHGEPVHLPFLAPASVSL